MDNNAPSNKPAADTARGKFARLFLQAAEGVNFQRIPVPMAMAVAALETGWGAGGLFKRTNSLFNIKATPSWGGARAEVNGSEGKVFFRAYPSLRDSIVDWVQLISGRQIYAKAYLFAQAGDFKGFFDSLQKAGYAGADHQYSAKLERTFSALA